MKITNRLGLPEALVEACRNDPYDAGDADISLTRLISPPRMVALMRAHDHELEEDVADRIWALRSQGMHTVLERAAGVNEIAEIRWTIKCLGWKVSGKLDLVSLLNGVLTDWKDTSVWSIKDALDPTSHGKQEWEQQTNLLAYFGRRYDHSITAVQVVAFGRDWRRREKLRYGGDYPEHEVSVVPLPLWSDERCQQFLEERVRLHQAARKELPICSSGERWEKPTIYAVHKRRGETVNKGALRVYEDRTIAETHVAQDPAGLVLQVRPPESPRCGYCSAFGACTQGQDLQRRGLIPGVEA